MHTYDVHKQKPILSEQYLLYLELYCQNILTYAQLYRVSEVDRTLNMNYTCLCASTSESTMYYPDYHYQIC